MIQIPLIDELREIRRQLAERCGADPRRYAEMLRDAAKQHAGPTVNEPPRPEVQVAPAS
jgi:hypothetical protein